MKKIITCCLSAIACSMIVAFGMGNIIHQQRTVSVRGLSEREVDSDMAVWKLSFSAGSNSLVDLRNQIISKTELSKAFLKAKGLSEADYTVLAPEITDATVNLYSDPVHRSFDYVAKQTIMIRSSNVQGVKNASENTIELLGQGISVSADWDGKVQYYFNGLNDIKPEMIAEATENARKAAEKFAHDSNSKVGKIQNASQGLFTIEDAAPGMEYKKSVRVVTTVVYSLAD